MLKVGDAIRVLAPFDVAFPGQYLIEYIDENGVCGICGDRDFDAIYLEKV